MNYSIIPKNNFNINLCLKLTNEKIKPYISYSLIFYLNDVYNQLRRVPYITFTHMKPYIQNWQHPTEHWMKKVNVYFDSQCRIKIDNFMQQGLLHYVESEFLHKDLLNNLERRYNEHC